MSSDFIEIDPDPLVYDATGYKTARNFDVLARSQLDVLAILRRYGICYGAVWQTSHSEAPDYSIVCKSIVVTSDPEAVIGGFGRYFAKANYERRVDEPVIGGPPVYRVKGGLVSEPVDIDVYGNPIVNAADEPIDPPLTISSVNEVLNVSWYQQTDDIYSLQMSLREYRGAVNSEKWRGAMALSFLCHGVDIIEELDEDWVKLGADFEYRHPIDPSELSADIYKRTSGGSLSKITSSVGGWVGIYANRGRREKGEVKNGKRDYPAILVDGQPVSEPVDLAGDGTRLDITANQVAIIVPLVARQKDFSELGV